MNCIIEHHGHPRSFKTGRSLLVQISVYLFKKEPRLMNFIRDSPIPFICVNIIPEWSHKVSHEVREWLVIAAIISSAKRQESIRANLCEMGKILQGS